MTKEQIEKRLTDLGFSATATLVRDEFNPRKLTGSSVWAVTVICNGHSHSIEYTAGCAHRRYYSGRRLGKVVKLPYGRKMTNHEIGQLKQTVPIKPDVVDIVSALVVDAGCVSYHRFEDFCAEFGWDTDSRRAEKCYNACRDTRDALIRMVGSDGLDDLLELFRDY